MNFNFRPVLLNSDGFELSFKMAVLESLRGEEIELDIKSDLGDSELSASELHGAEIVIEQLEIDCNEKDRQINSLKSQLENSLEKYKELEKKTVTYREERDKAKLDYDQLGKEYNRFKLSLEPEDTDYVAWEKERFRESLQYPEGIDAYNEKINRRLKKLK